MRVVRLHTRSITPFRIVLRELQEYKSIYGASEKGPTSRSEATYPVWHCYGYQQYMQSSFVRACPTRSTSNAYIPISLESPKKYRFTSYCWECLVAIIPDTLLQGQNSEDFYGVTITILRNLDDSHRENLDLTAYVQAWTKLLLDHHHDEVR